MARVWILTLLLLQISVWRLIQGQCVPRQFGHDSFVCVCNATYCDELGVVDPPASGTYARFTSTREAERLTPSSGELDSASVAASFTINVNTSAQYQAILGFGGCFTDSTAFNFNALSDGARNNALRAYFAPEGIEYSVCRVTIGGSDFSTRPYSLDDVEGDVDLEFWALQPEDLNDKIPNILRALELSDQEVLILGSSWSPPAWMKNTGMFNGSGSLLPEMWQPYANYLVKWVEAYEEAGVPLWGLTPQNEPQAEETDWPINTCHWTPEDMRDWLRDNLGPSLEQAGYRRLKMMVNDYNREYLPWYIEPMLADPECSKYIDGVAVHWYTDSRTGPEVLTQTHDLDPTKFMLYTEACAGTSNPSVEESILKGDWYRGEHYLQNVLEDLNYWSTGWLEWNMAVDLEGGPHWPNDPMDASILVDAENDEFYKQPMFYALAHVSKFMKRDSIRVGTAVSDPSVASASVIYEDGTVVVVVLNTLANDTDVSISIDGTRFINTELPTKSFQTFVVSPD